MPFRQQNSYETERTGKHINLLFSCDRGVEESCAIQISPHSEIGRACANGIHLFLRKNDTAAAIVGVLSTDKSATLVTLRHPCRQ